MFCLSTMKTWAPPIRRKARGGRSPLKNRRSVGKRLPEGTSVIARRRPLPDVKGAEAVRHRQP